MSKFRVGDRVRVTDTLHDEYKNGDLATVKERYTAIGGEAYYCLRGKDNKSIGVLAKYLELAPAFPINSGDYIDSREFTREECERFCEIAVECGFELGCRVSAYWCAQSNMRVSGYGGTKSYELSNNITTQFREFLDKEKGMKQDKDLQSFTKGDLKDGMRGKDKKGDVYYVGGNKLYCQRTGEYNFISSFNGDLTHPFNNKFDFVEFTDRDGTVVFKREEETIITMQEIADWKGVPLNQLKIKGE